MILLNTIIQPFIKSNNFFYLQLTVILRNRQKFFRDYLFYYIFSYDYFSFKLKNICIIDFCRNESSATQKHTQTQSGLYLFEFILLLYLN